MLNISGFLEKFRKFDADKTLQRENIAKNLEKILGINIPSKNLTIKNKVLYVQGSPALKQEIFLKKQQLIQEIGSEIVDIR